MISPFMASALSSVSDVALTEEIDRLLESLNGTDLYDVIWYHIEVLCYERFRRKYPDVKSVWPSTAVVQ